MGWRDDGHEALNDACSAFTADHCRRAILLLDDAVSVVVQGHLSERDAEPPRTKRGGTAPIPEYLKAMVRSGDPPMSVRRYRSLRRLHEIRSLFVHKALAQIEVAQYECQNFLHETIRFAGDYGVRPPLLVPSALELVEPVRILVEFDPRTTPARHSQELRRFAVDYCTRRGILAGFIDNIGWPLVRCCLCRRLVSADQATITQEDCMADDCTDPSLVDDDCDGFFTGEPPLPYCTYGCARAHQAWMREEYGDDATSTDYYLQPLIDVPTLSE